MSVITTNKWSVSNNNSILLNSLNDLSGVAGISELFDLLPIELRELKAFTLDTLNIVLSPDLESSSALAVELSLSHWVPLKNIIEFSNLRISLKKSIETLESSPTIERTIEADLLLNTTVVPVTFVQSDFNSNWLLKIQSGTIVTIADLNFLQVILGSFNIESQLPQWVTYEELTMTQFDLELHQDFSGCNGIDLSFTFPSPQHWDALPVSFEAKGFSCSIPSLAVPEIDSSIQLHGLIAFNTNPLPFSYALPINEGATQDVSLFSLGNNDSKPHAYSIPIADISNLGIDFDTLFPGIGTHTISLLQFSFDVTLANKIAYFSMEFTTDQVWNISPDYLSLQNVNFSFSGIATSDEEFNLEGSIVGDALFGANSDTVLLPMSMELDYSEERWCFNLESIQTINGISELEILSGGAGIESLIPPGSYNDTIQIVQLRIDFLPHLKEIIATSLKTKLLDFWEIFPGANAITVSELFFELTNTREPEYLFQTEINAKINLDNLILPVTFLQSDGGWGFSIQEDSPVLLTVKTIEAITGGVDLIEPFNGLQVLEVLLHSLDVSIQSDFTQISKGTVSLSTPTKWNLIESTLSMQIDNADFSFEQIENSYSTHVELEGILSLDDALIPIHASIDPLDQEQNRVLEITYDSTNDTVSPIELFNLSAISKLGNVDFSTVIPGDIKDIPEMTLTKFFLALNHDLSISHVQFESESVHQWSPLENILFSNIAIHLDIAQPIIPPENWDSGKTEDMSGTISGVLHFGETALSAVLTIPKNDSEINEWRIESKSETVVRIPTLSECSMLLGNIDLETGLPVQLGLDNLGIESLVIVMPSGMPYIDSANIKLSSSAPWELPSNALTLHTLTMEFIIDSMDSNQIGLNTLIQGSIDIDNQTLGAVVQNKSDQWQLSLASLKDSEVTISFDALNTLTGEVSLDSVLPALFPIPQLQLIQFDVHFTDSFQAFEYLSIEISTPSWALSKPLLLSIEQLHVALSTSTPFDTSSIHGSIAGELTIGYFTLPLIRGVIPVDGDGFYFEMPAANVSLPDFTLFQPMVHDCNLSTLLPIDFPKFPSFTLNRFDFKLSSDMATLTALDLAFSPNGIEVDSWNVLPNIPFTDFAVQMNFENAQFPGFDCTVLLSGNFQLGALVLPVTARFLFESGELLSLITIEMGRFDIDTPEELTCLLSDLSLFGFDFTTALPGGEGLECTLKNLHLTLDHEYNCSGIDLDWSVNNFWEIIPNKISLVDVESTIHVDFNQQDPFWGRFTGLLALNNLDVDSLPMVLTVPQVGDWELELDHTAIDSKITLPSFDPLLALAGVELLLPETLASLNIGEWTVRQLNIQFPHPSEQSIHTFAFKIEFNDSWQFFTGFEISGGTLCASWDITTQTFELTIEGLIEIGSAIIPITLLKTNAGWKLSCSIPEFESIALSFSSIQKQLPTIDFLSLIPTTLALPDVSLHKLELQFSPSFDSLDFADIAFDVKKWELLPDINLEINDLSIDLSLPFPLDVETANGVLEGVLSVNGTAFPKLKSLLPVSATGLTLSMIDTQFELLNINAIIPALNGFDFTKKMPLGMPDIGAITLTKFICSLNQSFDSLDNLQFTFILPTIENPTWTVPSGNLQINNLGISCDFTQPNFPDFDGDIAIGGVVTLSQVELPLLSRFSYQHGTLQSPIHFSLSSIEGEIPDAVTLPFGQLSFFDYNFTEFLPGLSDKNITLNLFDFRLNSDLTLEGLTIDFEIPSVWELIPQTLLLQNVDVSLELTQAEQWITTGSFVGDFLFDAINSALLPIELIIPEIGDWQLTMVLPETETGFSLSNLNTLIDVTGIDVNLPDSIVSHLSDIELTKFELSFPHPSVGDLHQLSLTTNLNGTWTLFDGLSLSNMVLSIDIDCSVSDGTVALEVSGTIEIGSVIVPVVLIRGREEWRLNLTISSNEWVMLNFTELEQFLGSIDLGASLPNTLPLVDVELHLLSVTIPLGLDAFSYIETTLAIPHWDLLPALSLSLNNFKSHLEIPFPFSHETLEGRFEGNLTIGNFELPLFQGVLPISIDGIDLSMINSSFVLPTLDVLTPMIEGVQFSSLLPPHFPVLSNYTLNRFNFSVAPDFSRLNALDFAIQTPSVGFSGWQLPVPSNLTFKEIIFDFDISNPSIHDFSGALAMGALIELPSGDLPVIGSFSLEHGSLSGNLIFELGSLTADVPEFVTIDPMDLQQIGFDISTLLPEFSAPIIELYRFKLTFDSDLTLVAVDINAKIAEWELFNGQLSFSDVAIDISFALPLNLAEIRGTFGGVLNIGSMVLPRFEGLFPFSPGLDITMLEGFTLPGLPELNTLLGPFRFSLPDTLLPGITFPHTDFDLTFPSLNITLNHECTGFDLLAFRLETDLVWNMVPGLEIAGLAIDFNIPYANLDNIELTLGGLCTLGSISIPLISSLSFPFINGSVEFPPTLDTILVGLDFSTDLSLPVPVVDFSIADIQPFLDGIPFDLSLALPGIDVENLGLYFSKFDITLAVSLQGEITFGGLSLNMGCNEYWPALPGVFELKIIESDLTIAIESPNKTPLFYGVVDADFILHLTVEGYEEMSLPVRLEIPKEGDWKVSLRLAESEIGINLPGLPAVNSLLGYTPDLTDLVPAALSLDSIFIRALEAEFPIPQPIDTVHIQRLALTVGIGEQNGWTLFPGITVKDIALELSAHNLTPEPAELNGGIYGTIIIGTTPVRVSIIKSTSNWSIRLWFSPYYSISINEITSIIKSVGPLSSIPGLDISTIDMMYAEAVVNTTVSDLSFLALFNDIDTLTLRAAIPNSWTFLNTLELQQMHIDFAVEMENGSPRVMRATIGGVVSLGQIHIPLISTIAYTFDTEIELQYPTLTLETGVLSGMTVEDLGLDGLVLNEIEFQVSDLNSFGFEFDFTSIIPKLDEAGAYISEMQLTYQLPAFDLQDLSITLGTNNDWPLIPEWLSLRISKADLHFKGLNHTLSGRIDIDILLEGDSTIDTLTTIPLECIFPDSLSEEWVITLRHDDLATPITLGAISDLNPLMGSQLLEEYVPDALLFTDSALFNTVTVSSFELAFAPNFTQIHRASITLSGAALTVTSDFKISDIEIELTNNFNQGVGESLFELTLTGTIVVGDYTFSVSFRKEADVWVFEITEPITLSFGALELFLGDLNLSDSIPLNLTEQLGTSGESVKEVQVSLSQLKMVFNESLDTMLSMEINADFSVDNENDWIPFAGVDFRLTSIRASVTNPFEDTADAEITIVGAIRFDNRVLNVMVDYPEDETSWTIALDPEESFKVTTFDQFTGLFDLSQMNEQLDQLPTLSTSFKGLEIIGLVISLKKSDNSFIKTYLKATVSEGQIVASLLLYDTTSADVILTFSEVELTHSNNSIVLEAAMHATVEGFPAGIQSAIGDGKSGRLTITDLATEILFDYHIPYTLPSFFILSDEVSLKGECNDLIISFLHSPGTQASVNLSTNLTLDLTDDNDNHQINSIIGFPILRDTAYARALLDSESSAGIQLTQTPFRLPNVYKVLDALDLEIPGLELLDFGSGGAIRFNLPYFTFDGGAFSAEGSFEIVEEGEKYDLLNDNTHVKFHDLGTQVTSEFGISLSSIKNALEEKDLGFISNFFPETISPYNTTPATELITALSIDENNQDEYHESIQQYLQPENPRCFNFAVEFLGNSSIAFNIETIPDINGERPAIKFLQFTPPMLVGASVSRIGLGVMGGLLTFDFDGEIDIFNIPLLKALKELNLPSIPIFENWLPASNEVHLHISAKNLFSVIPTAIPIPLFFDDLSVSYKGIEGLGAGVSMSLPAPDTLLEKLELFSSIVSALSGDETPEASDDSFELAFTLQSLFIETPKYLGAVTLDPKAAGAEYIYKQDAVSEIYKIMYLISHPSPKNLVALFNPLDRLGDTGPTLGALTTNSSMMLTTPEEIRTDNPTDLDSAVLDSLLANTSDGPILLMGGSWEKAGLISAQAALGMQISGFEGMGTLMHISGSVGGGFMEFNLTGSIALDFTNKSAPLALSASGDFSIASERVLSCTLNLNPNTFEIVEATLFPDNNLLAGFSNSTLSGYIKSSGQFALHGTVDFDLTPFSLSAATVTISNDSLIIHNTLGSTWSNAELTIKALAINNALALECSADITFDYDLKTPDSWNLSNLFPLGDLVDLSNIGFSLAVTVSIKLTVTNNDFEGLATVSAMLFGNTIDFEIPFRRDDFSSFDALKNRVIESLVSMDLFNTVLNILTDNWFDNIIRCSRFILNKGGKEEIDFTLLEYASSYIKATFKEALDTGGIEGDFTLKFFGSEIVSGTISTETPSYDIEGINISFHKEIPVVPFKPYIHRTKYHPKIDYKNAWYQHSDTVRAMPTTVAIKTLAKSSGFYLTSYHSGTSHLATLRQHVLADEYFILTSRGGSTYSINSYHNTGFVTHINNDLINKINQKISEIDTSLPTYIKSGWVPHFNHEKVQIITELNNFKNHVNSLSTDSMVPLTPPSRLSTTLESHQKFNIDYHGHGVYTIKSSANNRYVAADLSRGDALIADRVHIGPWEKFNFEIVGGTNPHFSHSNLHNDNPKYKYHPEIKAVDAYTEVLFHQEEQLFVPHTDYTSHVDESARLLSFDNESLNFSGTLKNLPFGLAAEVSGEVEYLDVEKQISDPVAYNKSQSIRGSITSSHSGFSLVGQTIEINYDQVKISLIAFQNELNLYLKTDTDSGLYLEGECDLFINDSMDIDVSYSISALDIDLSFDLELALPIPDGKITFVLDNTKADITISVSINFFGIEKELTISTTQLTHEIESVLTKIVNEISTLAKGWIQEFITQNPLTVLIALYNASKKLTGKLVTLNLIDTEVTSLNLSKDLIPQIFGEFSIATLGRNLIEGKLEYIVENNKKLYQLSGSSLSFDYMGFKTTGSIYGKVSQDGNFNLSTGTASLTFPHLSAPLSGFSATITNNKISFNGAWLGTLSLSTDFNASGSINASSSMYIKLNDSIPAFTLTYQQFNTHLSIDTQILNDIHIECSIGFEVKTGVSSCTITSTLTVFNKNKSFSISTPIPSDTGAVLQTFLIGEIINQITDWIKEFFATDPMALIKGVMNGVNKVSSLVDVSIGNGKVTEMELSASVWHNLTGTFSASLLGYSFLSGSITKPSDVYKITAGSQFNKSGIRISGTLGGDISTAGAYTLSGTTTVSFSSLTLNNAQATIQNNNASFVSSFSGYSLELGISSNGRGGVILSGTTEISVSFNFSVGFTKQIPGWASFSETIDQSVSLQMGVTLGADFKITLTGSVTVLGKSISISITERGVPSSLESFISGLPATLAHYIKQSFLSQLPKINTPHIDIAAVKLKAHIDKKAFGSHGDWGAEWEPHIDTPHYDGYLYP